MCRPASARSAIVTPAPMKKRLSGPVIRDASREIPKMASAIVTPAKPKPLSDNGYKMPDGQDQPRRSAIVEPKKPRNTMLSHLLEDSDPEAHRRASDKADELFREIVRRVAANKRD